MKKKVGVVLLNLGGPNNESAVQPFLYNLFMDDDIFKLPIKGRLRAGLMKFVTTQRAKTVAKKYAEINACPEGCLGPASCSNRQQRIVSTCCSATNPITEWQRRSLQKDLNKNIDEQEFVVVTAMRYWQPDTDKAIDALLEAGVEEVVLLPLYPHFSYTTTGSSLNEWYRRLRARNLEDRWVIHTIKDYHRHPGYLAALNQRIDEGLEAIPEDRRGQVQLLFSAHGTPVSFRNAGDPYEKQINGTMEALMALRKYDRPYWLSFQSRVGPVEWLKPNTEKFLEVLYGYGIRDLLVIPISFVGDHIETKMEIGIEFGEVAEELGFRTFEHTSGLNDQPRFITSLKDMTLDALSKPQQVEENIMV